MPLVQTRSLEIRGDFTDSIATWHKFVTLINKLPDLTVLATLKHDFPGGGFSGCIILGESHAAIHTWAELDKAWVELATCGDPQTLDLFASLVVAGMSNAKKRR